MDAQLFAQTYLQYEQNIVKVLRSQKIYDEDLLHDTYIALYDHSQHAEIRDFLKTFIAFYRTRCKRRIEHESPYIACDNATLVEHFDRPEETDLDYREQIGRRVDNLIGYYCAHPLPGERNHKRACEILLLYREGLSYVEIAKRLKIDESTVKKYFKRTIMRLKDHGKMATI